jgi:tight adherence protein C
MMLLAILSLVLAGVAIAAVTRAVSVPRLRADDRLRQIGAYGYGAADGLGGDAASRSARGPADIIGSWLSPRIGREREEALRRELVSAGMYTLEPRTLLGYRVLAAAAGGMFGLLADPLIVVPGPIVDTLFLAYCGWSVPLTIVHRRATARLAEIERGIPDLIDLLVIMMESGSGFGNAVRQCAGRTKGALGQELRLSLQEQRFGLSLEESMEHMLLRTDTPSMRSFVRSVTQGEALGVSIGSIMRNLAHEMRLRRRQRAEERAQKAPVKMLFPLIFCILPALMVVLIAPALIQIAQTLGS